MKKIALLFVFILIQSPSFTWGFFAHKKINKQAVYLLPQKMNDFFVENILLLEEKAVDADKRRHSDEEEAPKHYIDIDYYDIDSPFVVMPRRWKAAELKFSKDTLLEYGILPWHIQNCYYQLVEAFKDKDPKKVIFLSADIGHYLADAHVPLHTTLNYDGQLSNQKGIHAFWESRLPELFSEEYDFFLPKVKYCDNILDLTWDIIENSHLAKDSVLLLEEQLNHRFPSDKKYSFEERNSTSVKVYSKEYSKEYHILLDGMVERQMRKAIYTIACVWYSSWVDAGQPKMDDWQLK
jgi:hypothetical protein